MTGWERRLWLLAGDALALQFSRNLSSFSLSAELVFWIYLFVIICGLF